MSGFEVTSRTHKQSSSSTHHQHQPPSSNNLSIYSPSNSITSPSLHALPSPPLQRSSIISTDSNRPSDSIDPRPPRIPNGSQVLVTRDSDAAYFVDLSASSSPAAIKERIYAKLGIYDDEHATCRISRSRAGQPIGLPLDDWQLWDLCMRSNQDSDPPMLIVISSALSLNGAPLSAHSSHSSNILPPTSAHRTAIHSPHSPESTTHPKYDNYTSSPGRESPEFGNSLRSARSRWQHSNSRIDPSSQSIPNQTSLAPHPSHLPSHTSPRSPAFNEERRASALMAITSSNTPFEIPSYLLPRQAKGPSADNPENWTSARTSTHHNSRTEANSRNHTSHDRRPSEPAPLHTLSPSSQFADGRSDPRVADHPRSRPSNDHIPSPSNRRDMQSAKSMDDLRHHHDHPRWALPGATHPPLPGAERPPSSNATISSRAPAPLRIPRSNNHPGQSNELVSQRSLQHLPLSSSSRSGPSHPNLAPTVAFPQPTPLRGRTPGTPGYGARPSSSSGYARAELRGQTVSSARQQALNGFVNSQHPQPPRTAVPLSSDHRYLEPARNPHWSSETTPSRSTHSLERPMQAPLAAQPHIQQAVSHSALQCRPGDVLQDSFQQGEQRRERVRELGPETDQAGIRRARPNPTPNSSMSASLPPRIRPVSRALNAYSLPPRQPSSPALTNSSQRVDDVGPATQRIGSGEDLSLTPGRGPLRRPPHPHKSASKASSVRSSDSSLHSPLSSRLVTEEFGERGYYHPPRHGLDRKSHTRRPNSARSSPSSDCISPATEISLLSSTAGHKARFEDSSPAAGIASSLKDTGLGNPEDHSPSQLAYISADVDSPGGPLILTPTLLPQRSKENPLRHTGQEGGYGDEGVSTVRADELSKDLAVRFSQLQMDSNMNARPSISDTTATRSPSSTSISNGTWRTSVSSNPTTVHSGGPEILKNQNPFGIIEDDDDDELVGTFVTPMKPSIITTTAPLSTGKPKLTLKTDTAAERPVRPPRLAPPTTVNQHHSSSTSTSSLMIPSAAKRDGDRRTSFTGDDWAVRPAVDEVYEHLEEFFPHHDLDKPIDIGPPPPCSPISPSPCPSPQPSRLNGRARSIRVVAQEKKKLLKRGGPMSSNALSAGDITSAVGNGSQSALLRRKSTKLWGARIEEVVPGSMHLSIPNSIDETRSADRDEDPDNFSFKWVKGELIGKGSFGQVYLALNATNGEMLAVKQVELPKTRSDRDDERQKSVVAALKSEIHLMRDLEHPNIVQYLGFEETTVYLSIFLEYIPGGSIGRCLRRHGAFELNVIKSFTSQVLEGLKYLHSLHILHRDLKADNLLVDLDGNCKISDFGISKKSDNIYQDNTQMSLQGSIFWMAPEVVHNPGKKGYSAKVDIWSLGCVVLEMFAGRRPWSDEEAIQAMFKLGAERLRPPVPADVKLGRMSDHFLAQCFIVDPELRPTADRLTDHRFLELDDKCWRFEHSELYRSIRMPGLSAG